MPPMSGDDRESVLVIDDDPVQRIIVVDVLEQLGRTNVLTAVDGAAASAIMKKQSTNVGLIICDLHMPNFDGVEFLLYLKDTAVQVPIMIVSGAEKQLLRSVEHLASAHDLNLIAAVGKPMDIGQLEVMINTHSMCQVLSPDLNGDTERSMELLISSRRDSIWIRRAIDKLSGGAPRKLDRFIKVGLA